MQSNPCQMNAIQCNHMQRSVASGIQCNPAQFSAVQSTAMECNPIQWITAGARHGLVNCAADRDSIGLVHCIAQGGRLSLQRYCSGLHWMPLDCLEFHWVHIIANGCTGLHSSDMDWIVFDAIGLPWVALDCFVLQWIGVHCM